ncbi:Ribosomal RNA large subunit methyltransferase H [Thalassoporum mexicanum PCC 7367]|uniref:23S rRNA (pseudouridine(1915)-N(3))-methyltransferase RlmH n=1 Tax=Thalassoporum mexicanum TaxID=3457544 RepID=UPI00029F9E2C|nr:Ribosomal RNA large subunit methyltransferase H [Pseudanabaena sp. PCC 7367]
MQGVKARIIAVGKIKKKWIAAGVNEYLKRLPRMEIQEIKDTGKEKEAEKILAMLKQYDNLIVLSEDGEMFDSIELSQLLNQEMAQDVVFAIGGQDGVSETLKQSARRVLSLSRLTFPHELARLILVEQIYRAQTIINHQSYHR